MWGREAAARGSALTCTIPCMVGGGLSKRLHPISNWIQLFINFLGMDAYSLLPPFLSSIYRDAEPFNNRSHVR
jgi:hypothetical protein